MRRRTLLAAGALCAAPTLALKPQAPSSERRAAPPAPSTLDEEVRGLLQQQAAQWSAGDLEGFCAHYADDAIFLSPSGRTDGRAAVLSRYRKKYMDKKGMGALTLEVQRVHAAGDESHAVASVALVWKLAFDDKAPAQGFSVIGLEKRRGGPWRIAHDASM